jgi:hypothetical protein
MEKTQQTYYIYNIWFLITFPQAKKAKVKIKMSLGIRIKHFFFVFFLSDQASRFLNYFFLPFPFPPSFGLTFFFHFQFSWH